MLPSLLRYKQFITSRSCDAHPNIPNDMQRTYTINNSTLTVVFGDLLNTEKDVIVSSDDGLLTMGGGVSGAIRRGCGERIMAEVKKHRPASLGDVVVTSAYELPQKYIFHAVTIASEKRMGRTPGKADEDTEVQKFVIRHSVDKCFRLVADLGLSSIAFPAIGAGSAAIPYQVVATEMSAAISKNLFRTNRHLEVELYLLDRYGEKSEMDFIMFFEQIAISIHDAEAASRADAMTVVKRSQNTLATDGQELHITDLAKEKRPQVFASYSRCDKDAVLPICKELQLRNTDVWIDLEGVYHGQNFKEVIVDAIEKSSIVLFFSSKDSNASHYVQREIAVAVETRKHIIPILLDDTKFAKSIQFDLCNIDYVNYTQRDAESVREIVDDIISYIVTENSWPL